MIRTVLANDMDTVYRFICLLEDEQFDKEIFSKHFLQNITNDNYIYLLAEIDGVAVGYLSCHGQILLHHNGWVYEIQEMFVDEEQRNKRVGHSLLEALNQKLKDVSCDMVEVSSNNKRTDTHRFYCKNSFVQTHQKFTKKRG